MGSGKTSLHPDEQRVISVEGNFEDLPFFSMTAGGGGLEKIVYKWFTDYVDSEGKQRRVPHRWEVEGSKKYGLPAGAEQDVYVALLELLEERGGAPEDGILYFSIYELLKLMGRTKGGSRYQRVRQALSTIARTMIESYAAFYSKRLGKYITDEFNLFTVHWAELKDLEGNRLWDRNRLVLHPYFVESYNENYLGRLDADFYWSLEEPTSKRLYRLLDRRAAEKRDGGPRVWEVDLYELRDRMPLSGHYPSTIKQALGPAHEELTEKGFLKKIYYREERGRDRRKRWVVARYRLTKDFAKRRFSKKIDLTEEQRTAVAQLRAWNVSGTAAVEAVLKYGPGHCEKWARLLHFQKNVDDKRTANLLLWALEEEPEFWEEMEERAVSGPPGLDVASERAEQASLFVASGEHTDGEEAGGNGWARPEYGRLDERADAVWGSLAEEFSFWAEPDEPFGWFMRFAGYRLEGDWLVIVAPDREAADELIQRFGDEFGDLWRARRGEDARVSVGELEAIRTALGAGAGEGTEHG